MGTRSRNVIRNIFTGIVGKVVSILLPFVTRTAILYSLGATYLGLGTLFSSVLSFLGLAELGIGSAIAFAMYKPIANNDIERISSLLGYIKRIYRRIGTVVIVVGGIIVPIIPMLIKGDVPPNINIYKLYLLYLVNISISYFFAGYRQVLLNAFQRMDILNVVLLLVNIFVYTSQTLAVVITKNYYVFATIPIFGTIINNFLNLVITKRMFPEIECSDHISERDRDSIKKRIGGLFGTKLNSLVIHQADMIVISSFIGLNMVAIYGNYYYIMNAVCELIMVLFSSMIASIGNKMATDGVEQNYALFKKIYLFNEWIVSIASACFVCLYQPFMRIWVGEEYMLNSKFVILLVIYFFIYEIQRTILAFKDAAGIWREDQVRPYVSMIVNVFLNILLVQYIGIYGIVLSTIIAFTISLPWANHVLFNSYFKRNPMENIFRILKSIVVTVVICCFSYVLCKVGINNIWGIIFRLFISCITANVIFIIVNRKQDTFIDLIRDLHVFIEKGSR